VVVLLLDTYAFLVNYKYSWEQVLQRTEYYRYLVKAVLEAIGISSSRVRFVENSSYEGTKEFVIDHYKLCALLSRQDCMDTGAEVSASTMFSPMLTPGLQSLAEEYLDIDMQFGGTDQVGHPIGFVGGCRMLNLNHLQRGIFHMAETFLPQLGYRKRAHLLNEMLPSLVGGKMSSSDPPTTKIMFLDGPDTVRKKIAGANCEAGDIERNGILPTLKEVLIPISELRADRWMPDLETQTATGYPRPFCSEDAPKDTVFSVEQGATDSRGSRHYKSYSELQQDFLEKKLDPEALKTAVAEAINQLLSPIRSAYKENKAWRAADEMAYPGEIPMTN
jgi:tyrosyl-tRNA synthetase